MITTCTGCQIRYQLDDGKVPRRLIRVRCPKCEAIFLLDGTLLSDESQGAGEGPMLSPQGESRGDFGPLDSPPPSETAGPSIPAGQPGMAAGVVPEAQTPVATEVKRPRRSRDKAQMLARALVSDILVYNQDARDQALQEGKLLEVLGPEIKKSWELYKEKVTPEVANKTSHFRDALNEILAEGQKVF